MFTFSDFKKQVPQTLRLATPLAIAQLGQMLMGLIDTLMVGKLGPQFIGAAGLGNSIFWICGLPCIGLLAGLDYLVSFSFGRGDLKRCNFWLAQGFYFGLLISIPSAVLIYVIALNLDRFGFDAELAFHAKRFLAVYSWNVIPFALFMAFRQYVQSMNRVNVITAIMIVSNGVNAFFNWVFIYGHGVEPLGIAGAGIATFITRILMLAAVIAYTFYLDKRAGLNLREMPWKIDLNGIRELAKLGVPAAGQMTLEVGVFSLSTILAGRVDVISLAAHSLVLNIASFTFMVPLGVSAAAAILVGQAQGRSDHEGGRMAGWSSFVIGVGFMACSAVILYLFATPILSLFTQDRDVIALGKRLLLLAAFFQIADGTQVVGTGALRGLGETRLPMFANLFGHWFIGLPIGVILCFWLAQGVVGLWLGLTIGLIAVAVAILAVWIRKIGSRRPDSVLPTYI